MTVELELKFLLSGTDVPVLQHLAPTLGSVISSDSTGLLNAYFDTADKWFRRHDMGLRSRQKRGQFEQTIKLAGKQHGAVQQRPEYNVPTDGVVPKLAAFPADIWPDDAQIDQLQANLTELFRTDFTRYSWLLQLDDGSRIDLVCDQGNIVTAQHQQTISEIELELISGDARQLFKLARTILQHLPLHTGWLSKAARGYQLLAQTPRMLPAAPEAAQSLAQQVNALQQSEACYLQQANSEALLLAADYLQQVSVKLNADPKLQQWADVADDLAAQLKSKQVVFGQPQYNLLLLDLAEYLYFC